MNYNQYEEVDVDDEDSILRDGQKLRTPVQIMDGRSGANFVVDAASLARDAQARNNIVRYEANLKKQFDSVRGSPYPNSEMIPTHAPTPALQAQARSQAYAKDHYGAYDREISNRWKNP